MALLKSVYGNQRMDQLAEFMSTYKLRGQHTADRALTRVNADLDKMIENNEIATGPGRYALGVPNAYGNAAFAANPAVLNQKWGAAHDMSSTKTDVESDLRNLGRPSTRTVCGSYQPTTRSLTPMPEIEFPKTFERLVDPPCTLKGTGVNRWAWLGQNPQENVMMPFEWGVNTKLAAQDDYTDMIRQSRNCTGSINPAVPVARPAGPGAPPPFHDAIPGASQRMTGVPPAAHYTPHGAPQVGAQNPYAVPLGPSANPMDRHRAQTGILEPPAPFTAFIAPH
jgi:hypothetical protein